ncbi:MAG: epimerase [Isosphaeraceae bacterium]|nr:MAG: epimerase [Isosphaeraceae bacterium]
MDAVELVRGKVPFDSEAALEAALSEPTPEVVETLGRLGGDWVILGVGGKMGPSLARMVRRALDAAGLSGRVIGVSRFTGRGREALEAHGVETIAADLLEPGVLERLPDAANVIVMAGRKFGSTGDEPATWAQNAWLAGWVCRRYRGSRVVAFSTGNVYGLVPVGSGGSREEDAPEPVGEYAMSCLGRERIYEFFARRDGTPVALIRLNYATDLRYGVLVDLARRVWVGEPIELAMGYFNTIWQGDANALALRAFEHVSVPAWVVNVTGPERLSVREVARRFGAWFGVEPRFAGEEAGTALLSDATRCYRALGRPRVDADRLMEWVAGWMASGGRLLNKPTHFESRDGRF